MTDKDKSWLYSRLDKRAKDAAMATRLPGWQNGPADAFRHITTSGEATRRYGAEMAELLGNAVERIGNYPPVWKESGTPEAARVLARPVESWTQDDVRAVQRSKTYWRGDGPDRAAAFAKVRTWYERNTGPVVVRAYSRDDGTQVVGHSRAAPR